MSMVLRAMDKSRPKWRTKVPDFCMEKVLERIQTMAK